MKTVILSAVIKLFSKENFKIGAFVFAFFLTQFYKVM